MAADLEGVWRAIEGILRVNENESVNLLAITRPETDLPLLAPGTLRTDLR